MFPLGVYAVAGTELGRVAAPPIIEHLGSAWVWVAFPAWAITFAAMPATVLRGRDAAVSSTPPPLGR